MSRADDIIAIAESEIGYCEKSVDEMLDDPTAKAGSGNYTKYARELSDAGYYNGNKNGFAWCDVFTDWCFYKAYGKEEGQRIQCQTGELGADCNYSAQYYRDCGRYDLIPQRGDQIFFQKNGIICHTGIVASVTVEKIVTIEGNSSNKVMKNSYKRNDSSIAGYGHPLYSTILDEEVEVFLKVIRKGAYGKPVRVLQSLLNTELEDSELETDSDFGELTEDAVIRFQKKKFRDSPEQWDGIVGKNTWQQLLSE